MPFTYHYNTLGEPLIGQILLPKPNLGFISKWEGPPEKSSPAAADRTSALACVCGLLHSVQHVQLRLRF